MNSWSERSPSPGAWTSVLAIAGRQTRQNFRHVQTAIFMFVLPVAFGLLFGRLLHVAVASPPDRWVRVVMPGVSADMEGVARFLFYFGFLAMFVLTTALMNGAGILEERENRTLARLLVQGVPYGQVIAGHALGAALTSAIQTVVLLAIAYPMGGWPRSSVPATVAVALALALAAAGSAVGAAGVAGAGP
ncbi:MAG: ABC transporter permease, partial [Clostridia bacterium]|nr:ABC transporter permease [Clostridia bacterium]